MDTDVHSVEQVLKEARRFMVPIYQRKYQWGDERLQPFWDDVSTKAAEVLENESKFEHYMGALILSPVDQGSQIGRTPLVQVVDGQQRLTTFQIFLAALREVARDCSRDEFIGHIEGYLKNEPKSKDTDPLTRFKLTPTLSDRHIFQDIIELPYSEVESKYRFLFYGSRVPKNTSYPAFRAYFLFRLWITNFARNGPESDEELSFEGKPGIDETGEDIEFDSIERRLESLFSAVLDRLKLVVIELDEGDDAQVIFETLNSRGEPLLAMDLVRNNIFHRAQKQKVAVEALYEELWDPFDDSWWREQAPNARPRRPRLDHFLAHVLTAETGTKISVRELYAEYRTFAEPKGKARFENVQNELKLLESYSPLYETLEGREDSDSTLYWLGRKLSAWQVTTAYPIAMQIGAAEIDESEKHILAKLVYSFLTRRAICGLTTKGLNQVFQALAASFIANGVSIDTIREFFSVRSGDSTRFPDNHEFHVGIVEGNAYSIAPRPRLVDVLWEFEKASRSHMAENTAMPPGLWVEHVLPQTWTEEWPFDDGVVRERFTYEPEVLERNSLIHTLGNLTLLTGGLNISSGNSSYIEKRAKFQEHSGLFLNKWFLGRESWSETDIRERGEDLADKAKDIWIDLESVR